MAIEGTAAKAVENLPYLDGMLAHEGIAIAICAHTSYLAAFMQARARM